jgi:hypothetical protein
MERNATPALRFGIFSLLFFIAWQACVKPPDYPKEPVIEFSNISKTLMKQGKNGEDSVSITFNYTDGDGDLGYPDDSGGTSIFVKDGRDNFEKYEYKLPYVEPQGTGNGISGTITIKLPTSCCIEIRNGQSIACEGLNIALDSVTYLIRIKDRAGHFSNEISTPIIQLKCQ